MQTTAGEWQQLFSCFTTGIYILTTGSGNETHGMSASWIVQVSAEPPLLAAAVGRSYRTHAHIVAQHRFALNVVGARSRFLQDHFHAAASRGEGHFRGLRVERSPAGLPWLVDALASVDCEVVAEHPIGDRTLFVARPVAWRWGEADRPLTSLDLPYVYVGTLIPTPWKEGKAHGDGTKA